MSIEPITRKERILAGEDIEPITRLEYFMKEAAGGGGSSLPSYSSADKGKFLGLGDGTPSEQTVIPEQSVTLTAESGSAAYYFTDADNVNVGYFKSVSVGDSCVIVIGGVSENCTASDFLGASLFQTSGGYLIGYDPVQDLCGIVNMNLFDPVTITISAIASVPSVEPKWKAVGGGGDGVKIVELVQNTDTDNNACNALIKYNNNVLTSYEAVAAFITENPAIIAILSGVSFYNVMLPTRSTIVEGDLSAYYLFSVNGNQMSAGWTTR